MASLSKDVRRLTSAADNLNKEFIEKLGKAGVNASQAMEALCSIFLIIKKKRNGKN